MCVGMNYAFRDLKEMVTVDRERIRRMRTNYVVSEAIEKGKDWPPYLTFTQKTFTSILV